jgi:hypothetical protein
MGKEKKHVSGGRPKDIQPTLLQTSLFLKIAEADLKDERGSTYD